MNQFPGGENLKAGHFTWSPVNQVGSAIPGFSFPAAMKGGVLGLCCFGVWAG